jgi:hypothetical protein
MLQTDSPFPCYWWGTSFPSDDLAAVRPDRGTFGRYDLAQLPPLPFSFSGDLDWLARAPAHRHNIGRKYAAEAPEAIRFLRSSAASLGVRLPDAFIKFAETPSLQERIRSVTDCYVDLCPEPIRSPIGGGWLVHFLADSQSCLFWYLYLTENGSDHAVVASPDYYSTPVEWTGDVEGDGDDEESEDESPDPSAIVFCAESFEAFLCRYWIENEIWIAQHMKLPMPEVFHQYVEVYRARQ